MFNHVNCLVCLPDISDKYSAPIEMETTMNLMGVLTLREEDARIIGHGVRDYIRTMCNFKLRFRQKLSVLFPALGSKFNTVILGFTPCGDYLVTLDDLSVRFHRLLLSRQGIKIREMYYNLPQKLNTSSSNGLPWWTSPLEILMSSQTIDYLATLYFARYNDRYFMEDMDDIVALCDLNLYSLGKLVLSAPIPAVLNQSCLFELSTINDMEKTVLFINNGNYVSFYLFGKKGCEAEYNDIIEGTESGELPCELLKSKTFFHRYSAKSDWFTCNLVGSNSNTFESAIEQQTIPQSKFKVEKFLRNTLLPFYYPGLDVLKSLKAFEIRCLGPGEKGPYILMVISGLIIPNCGNKRHLSVEKEIAYLVALHPFLGDITVLKIKDLRDFCNSQKEDSSRTKSYESDGIFRRNYDFDLSAVDPGASFSSRVDFYCHKIRQSDPFLRHFCKSFKTLSSLDAVNGTLKVISHPILPLEIYNDECS